MCYEKVVSNKEEELFERRKTNPNKPTNQKLSLHSRSKFSKMKVKPSSYFKKGNKDSFEGKKNLKLKTSKTSTNGHQKETKNLSPVKSCFNCDVSSLIIKVSLIKLSP